ncbi:hypothetical protein LCGC14_0765190 [marine sediment metagenome]|uniref:Tyr recombinase domain-containing protein n=1 Tax=marine sediment metagenome TaxID=412755 RepID=A0A0F9SK65_9ZZZZ
MATSQQTATVLEASEPLENLKLILTSPRPRSPDTLTGYLSVARQFLTFLGDRVPPAEMDLRRYFLKRREGGISDSTLRTTFAVLQKLYGANQWKWPLIKEDRPEISSETDTPAFTREEVEQLIQNRELYSKGECFYLAMATVYAPRRIELARITKRDVKDNTIRIDTAKKGEKRTHLIPVEIMPYVEAYRPRENNVRTLTFMFDRICEKGLGKKVKGYGWHSFRRTIDTLLPTALAKADKPLTLVGYFLRWSRRSTGARFLGTPMGGVYARPEILSSDPFFVDREVFEVHPFLPLWADGDKQAL